MPIPNGAKGNPRFDLNDDPDFAADLTALSDWAATAIDRYVATTGARDAIVGAWPGMTVFVESNKCIYVWNGASYKILTTTSPISFTPALTGITIGAGTNDAEYIVAGGRYFVTGEIILAGATPVTGAVTVATPVPAVIRGQEPLRGIVTFVDVGTGASMGVVDQNASSGVSAVRLLAQNVAATYPAKASLSATIPHAWGNTDQILYDYSFLPA